MSALIVTQRGLVLLVMDMGTGLGAVHRSIECSVCGVCVCRGGGLGASCLRMVLRNKEEFASQKESGSGSF